MRLLENVAATTGQIVEELRQYVEMYPDFCVRFYDSCSAYIRDIGKATVDGQLVLVLLTSTDEDEALSIKSLIGRLEGYDDATGVLINWSGLNNYDLEDGKVFRFEEYDDEDDVDIWFFAGQYDIRLFSREQILADLGRFTEEYADARVVLYGEDDEPFFITRVEWDDHRFFIEAREESDESMPVTAFNKELSDYVTDDRCEFLLFCDEEDAVTRTLKRQTDGNLFYVDEYDGETVIACRLGEVIFEDQEFICCDDEDL